MKNRTPWMSLVGVFIAISAAMGAWIYASPVASDADGTFHLVSIWCGSGYKDGQCEPGMTHEGVTIPGVAMVPSAIARDYGNLDTTSLNGQFAANYRNNLSGLYPNGYYWFASKFVRSDVNTSVIILRWINVFIFSFFVLSANNFLPKNMQKGFALAFSILLMPLGLFIVASNNPSSWAVTSVGTYWVFLYVFLTEKVSIKRIFAGCLCGLSALIGMSARADASAYLVVTTLVVIALVHSRKLVEIKNILKQLILPAAVSICAIFSFLTALQSRAISSGFIAVNGLAGRDASSPIKFDLSGFIYNLTKLPGLFAGIFGLEGTLGILGGYITFYMPDLVPLSMVFLLGVFISHGRSQRAKLEVTTLVALFALIALMPLVVLNRSNALLPSLVQSRYLLPITIPLLGIYLSGSMIEKSIRTSRMLKHITFMILVASYAVALHKTLRVFVSEQGSIQLNLNQSKIWWWNEGPSPMTVLLFGTLGWAVAISIVVYGHKKYFIFFSFLLKSLRHLVRNAKMYFEKVKLINQAEQTNH